MNLPALAIVLLALAQSDTSALVEAAKEAKAKRKGSTTKVITNATVAKADKSKVNVRQGVSTEPIEPQPTLMEKHAAERTARLADEATLKTLHEEIGTLEKELTKLEQAYYETNDLDYRDRELAKRFDETKSKLDELRTAAVTAAEQAASRRPPDTRPVVIEVNRKPNG